MTNAKANEMTAVTAPDEGESQGLSQTTDAARDVGEVQSGLIMARRYPRDEDRAYQQMMKATARPTFQAAAVYRFPRAGQDIVGPSVGLTNLFKQKWGNMWSGFWIIGESEDHMHIRGWAFDLETNCRRVEDCRFKLLIKRKGKWIRPDERDRRELINRMGAIAERNCIRRILPSDMIADIVDACILNQQKGIANKLEESRKAIMAAFGVLDVPVAEIEELLGNPLTEANEVQISELRQIYQSIKDGVCRWTEYREASEEPAKPKIGAVNLTSLIEKKQESVAELLAAQTPAPQPPANERSRKVASEAPGPQNAPQEPAQEATLGSDVADWGMNIDEAEKIGDVTKILTMASSSGLSAQDFEAVGNYGKERIAQLRAARSQKPVDVE